ncbi:MAG: transketolase [Saprospiraceae bacterium]|nr:transketolase [Saprospiraceae bacterium]
MSIDIASLKDMASQVRRDIIRQTHLVNSGHPGGSLGCTDFLVLLYFEIMKHDPSFNMEGNGEDMFFLSNGHISPVWYSVLSRSGYFPVEELNTFRKINSRLQGHPATHEGLPGIRVASGSLGQGMSVAIGAALAKRLNKDDRFVYVLTGDGELQEGQVWEAAMFAPHYKLDNLIVTVDWNGQQIDGPNEKVMSLGDLKGKWTSFGWTVFEMDGHDFNSMIQTIQAAQNERGKGKPVCILMKTEMGKGVDFMEGTHQWHGKATNAEQTEIALSQLEETIGDY